MSDWVAVELPDELVDRKPVRVMVEGSPVLLVKADDDWFAVANQCTHQGAPLDKGVVKFAGSVHSVTCPAHGSTFNLDNGKVMRPPAAKPILVYDVKTEGGQVYLRTAD
jgi:3-phenylpropionate/trans-cinnamate dioxygenase ferredoxin component